MNVGWLGDRIPDGRMLNIPVRQSADFYTDRPTARFGGDRHLAYPILHYLVVMVAVKGIHRMRPLGRKPAYRATGNLWELWPQRMKLVIEFLHERRGP
jgi:hypothetical protein